MSDARRVVIADDEPLVRDTLAGFFSTVYADCVVEAVADGEAAVDRVAALKQIRALASGVPVIMVTGNESSRLAGQVIGLGAHSYLPKPFRLQYLHHLVATIFDRAR